MSSFDRETIYQHLPPLDLERCFEPEKSVTELQALYRLYGFDKLQPALNCQHYFGRTRLGDFSCAVNCWVPEGQGMNGGRAVIIAHGLFDHGGLYLKLVAELLKSGFIVFLPDLPGHGLSEGELAAISGFYQYGSVISDSVLTLRQQGVVDISLIGQSTGASAILHYLLDVVGDSGVQRVVLLAPLVRPVASRLIKLFFPLLNLLHIPMKRYFTANSGDAAFCQFLEQQDPLQARKLPRCWVFAMLNWMRWFEKRVTLIGNGKEKYLAQPALIIQGLKDRTVDWRYNLPKIAAVFETHRQLEIADACHQLVNESDKIREQVFAEVLSFLQSQQVFSADTAPVAGSASA